MTRENTRRSEGSRAVRKPIARRKSTRTRKKEKRGKVWWGVAFLSLFIGGMVGYQQVEPVLANWATIHHISISGLHHLQDEDILARVQLPEQATLWSIDEEDIRQRVVSHPKIATAIVGRVMPDTLTITVQERKPAAILHNFGNRLVMDKEGLVLSNNVVAAHSDLPILKGLNATLLLNEDSEVRQRAQQGMKLAGWLIQQFEAQPMVDMKDSQDIVAEVQGLLFHFTAPFDEQWNRYQILEPTITASVKTGRREIDLRFPGKVIVRPRG